ncbi:MAG: tetratricopeptide repeat protein, partial [Candidatus Omnitrophota bacterium]
MKNTILLLATCAFLIQGTVSAAENFQEIDRILNVAFEHARNYPPEFTSEAQRDDVESNLRDVISQLEQMLKASGPGQEILFRLGKANTFAYNLDVPGSREKADEYFKQLFQLEPNHAEGHLYYGQHLSGRGEFDAAIENLHIAADAGLDVALNMIGLAYLQMGKIDEAKTYFQGLLEKYPGDPQI